MNYTKLPKKALLLLATPVFISLTVPAGKLAAQSQTETKIRLMAEGLRARDSGDLVTAKTNFEQLLVLAPSDVTVQRLLSGVNDSLARSGTPEVAAPTAVALNQVSYNPAAPSASSAAPAPAAGEVSVDAIAKAEEARIKDLIAAAKAESKAAGQLARSGDFDAASARLDAAARSLPVNTLTTPTINSLNTQKNELLLTQSQQLLSKGDVNGARAALDAYVTVTGETASRQDARVSRAELNPPLQPISKASPDFLNEQKEVAALLSKGRSQYVAGDVDGALETFRYIETISTQNAEAKYFLKRIAEERARLGVLNRERTRASMIEEVAGSWQRPGVFVDRPNTGVGTNRPPVTTLTNKLNNIIIPSVSFTGVDLGRVVNTLAAFSEEFDTSTDQVKGVNIVLGSTLAGTPVPQVNITLRNMSLRRMLDIITENVGYQVEVQADLVLVRPSGTDANLLTEEFAVSKAALTRMTGVSGGGASASVVSDPFAPAPAAGGGGAGGSEAESIKRFLSAAGVPFENVPGASLAYDGSRILVTHTNRNIERIRNIIGRYNDVRQVEIEAKFMDVQEGALEEMGIQWGARMQTRGTVLGFGSANPGAENVDGNGNPRPTTRTLAGAFPIGNTDNQGFINGNPIDFSSPAFPGGVDLGSSLGSLASATGLSIGEFDVNATLRALSLKSGSDLLSAPKVTVLSGNRATITVAQELRYPQSYGETQSTVSSGNTGGSAISITPGTPQDFTTRNVGVELSVTPTVEEDEYSISLELNPRVTEFEGFVEYGGQSAAVTTGSTVILPSGFYQPVFSTREINTRVTVWDGATLVMGGLTREETKRVNDKVPVLGDLPFIGRAFKSKGESTQKRNLLIFVTANLVSPGGSLKKQELRGVAPSATFQNPTYVTPSNSESRLRSSAE